MNLLFNLLSEVSQFFFFVKTSAEIRERDWCNVVTCHMDTAQAYVWRLQNFVLGEHILNPCPENPTPVKVRNSTSFNIFCFLTIISFKEDMCKLLCLVPVLLLQIPFIKKNPLDVLHNNNTKCVAFLLGFQYLKAC